MQIEIDDNYESYKINPEVLKSRLFENPNLDAAIIGTFVNGAGKRVLVYNQEAVEDIFAVEFEQRDDLSDDDESYHQMAAEHLSYHLSDYLHYHQPYAPLIVWEAIEDPEDYDEEFQVYRLNDEYWIGEA